MKLHIGRGNMKLPKTMLNFSLPPVKSCPYSTPKCRKWCYAKKAYRQYPSTKTAWDENFVISKQDNFADLMINELIKAKNWNTFRLHVSGDFYNQNYFDKWLKVINFFPSKTFYAYTKNNIIDISERPDNFIIIHSDDSDELIEDLTEDIENKKGEIIKTIRVDNLKKVIEEENEYNSPEDKITISKFNGIASVKEKGYIAKPEEFICSGSCETCNYCYSNFYKFKRVIFIKH